MARTRIGPASPDRSSADIEIARLRDFDVQSLRIQWRNMFRQPAPTHLPRYLMIRVLAYRLQADRFGDLDGASRRLLDRTPSPEAAGSVAGQALLRPGTILARDWNGKMHRVTVLSDGFSWNGETHASLSRVAFAITGTRWNGPRFFGLRARTGGAA